MKGHGGGATNVGGKVNTYNERKAVRGLENRVVNCIITGNFSCARLEDRVVQVGRKMDASVNGGSRRTSGSGRSR